MKNSIITFLLVLMGCLTVQKAGAQAQAVAFSTNTVMWATATPNLEVRMPLSKTVSLHLPVMYNPWVWKENSRTQQLTAMPGVRFWRQQCNVHYFFSVYGIATRYHMGGWFDRKYRYDGTGFGAGIGAGYSRVLSRHWNFECEFGFGAIWADYDKCHWTKDSRLYAQRSRLALIPTKFDLSFVYFY